MRYSMMKVCCLFIFCTCGFFIWGNAQTGKITVSGLIHDAGTKLALPYVNVMLYNDKDSMFIVGTITDEKGYFSLTGLKNNTGYYLSFSYSGYLSKMYPLLTGQLNNFLDIGVIDLKPDVKLMGDVTVTARKEVVADKMDKKTYSITANTSAAGGSLLEAMKNLPGVTTTQDGKIELRGSDKVMILVDGKQTALTGIGGQASLDNIPSSAIDRIEIINNPSSRYDANGNAGFINIIFKKEKKEGFNGKAGLAGGAGALWIKKDNYPGIRPQYQVTPKFNPSLALNYRKNKLNIFFQGDDLYTKTLNKNEFADRFYDNGEVVLQQTKRNRTTNILTLKSGVDWLASANNTLTISGLFSSEKILDRGDEPFFNKDLSERKRLWQFLEDELKTTVTASASWQHKLRQAGRILNTGFNYTFHREDEKYFFTNTMPAYTGLDSFKLLSDEHVADLNIDYTHPLRHGRFETGFKLRHRWIPVNMQFKPGLNSPLDVSAGGLARYEETIPAIYGNYIYETKKFEIEAGLRLEHVKLQYDVNENHPVYKSDGYNYSEPFPSFRLAYKVNDNNRFSFFYNRRVDRPNEVDIRIFPKYDDAEIIKVGNPALRPQFTSSLELGYRANGKDGYFFSSVYHKRMRDLITRIGTIVPGSTLIYNVFQNAGKSYSTGAELMYTRKFSNWLTCNLNMNGYQNIIDGFTVTNRYPSAHTYTAGRESIFSGNIKLNSQLQFSKQTEGQLVMIYQAPDLVPQGKVFSRFSIDVGIKKTVNKGNAEWYINATDIGNTLRYKREVKGNGFKYLSTDYYETQVIRIGYSQKF